MRALLPLVALFLAGLAETAAADPLPPRLVKFMATADEEKTLQGSALNDWKLIVPQCANPSFVGVNITAHETPTFDAAGKPVSGVWQATTKMEGCGQSRLLNVFYMASNGRLMRTATLPGTTIADPYLQRDGLTYAATGMAALAPKDCNDVDVLDTTFEGFQPGKPIAGQPGRVAQSWTEKWTVRACGVEGIVRMRFTPDARGTSITVRPDETVRISAR